MTHAELFKEHPTPGFDQPDCPGELALEWTRSEEVLHHGAPRQHAVELYVCRGCNTRVPFDASAGQVLNAHQPPPVTQLAAELARTFDVGSE